MALSTLWFVVIAVFWGGYLVLEGFDFGVGMLLRVIGRDEPERRVVLNTIGPVWDGNEVWLVVAVAATFGAFPDWYAALFSGFFPLMLVILLAVIARGVAIEFRGKRDSPSWRARWDVAIIGASTVLSLLWGLVFANIVRGVPVDGNQVVRGGLGELLHPYALLGALSTVGLFLTHGAMFLGLKTGGAVRARAVALAARAGTATVVVVGAFLIWTWTLRGDAVSGALSVLAGLALLAGLAAAYRGRSGWAFAGTFAAIGLTVAALFAGLYPDVLPSTMSAANSLTVHNATASGYALRVLTVTAAIFTPLVLLYQGWTYWVFRRRIDVHRIPA